MNDEPEPNPKNVVEALARCQSEIGRIEKLTPSQRGRDSKGISYAYRGIEEIAGRAQPLFAKYGVVVAPIADDVFSIEPITKGGNPWTANLVRFQWRIYGPGGTYIDAATWGQGDDNADKGVNKASTAAYKNLLLRLLTIGDPADEAEHENTAREHDLEALAAAELQQRVGRAYTELHKLDDNSKTAFAEWKGDRSASERSLAADTQWLEMVEAWLDERKAS